MTEASPPRSKWVRRLATVGRWAAIVSVLALALIGLLHFTQRTTVHSVRGLDGAVAPVSDAQFAVNLALLTGTRLEPGNRVEVALDGHGTYPRLWADLRGAQQSITLQIYYGAPGAMADQLAEILTDRARAGVRVFVLYDAFGNFTIPTNHLEQLTKHGIIVQPFRPIRLSRLHLANNRSHVRGIVIDGRIGWTGGFGIDDKWFGDGRTNGAWRETNVRFEGPAVRQLQSAFAVAWAEMTGVIVTGQIDVPRAADGAEAGVLFSAPGYGSTSAERFYALSMAAARKTMYITNAYFAPDENFAGQLVDAARRGVDVRLLTAGPRTDVQVVRSAGRAMYEKLLSAGVRIYEWQPTTLHAKTFVIDGEWSTIGSMNLDIRSLAINDEATLMVRDRRIGAEMERIFLDDLTQSREVLLREFQDRSWTERLREWAAGLVRGIL